MLGKMNQFDRRTQRVRRSLAKNGGGRPRLTVFRSSKHIYAQVIDDAKGHTVAAASSLEKELRSTLKTGADKAAAPAVGKLLAERERRGSPRGGRLGGRDPQRESEAEGEGGMLQPVRREGARVPRRRGARGDARAGAHGVGREPGAPLRDQAEREPEGEQRAHMPDPHGFPLPAPSRCIPACRGSSSTYLRDVP
jgi:large subunit ribosomal protein L18